MRFLLVFDSVTQAFSAIPGWQGTVRSLCLQWRMVVGVDVNPSGTSGIGVPGYESPQFPGRVSEHCTRLPLLSSCPIVFPGHLATVCLLHGSKKPLSKHDFFCPAWFLAPLQAGSRQWHCAVNDLPSSSLETPAGLSLVIPWPDGVTSLHISGWILGLKVGWSCVCRFLWCFCYYDSFLFCVPYSI